MGTAILEDFFIVMRLDVLFLSVFFVVNAKRMKFIIFVCLLRHMLSYIAFDEEISGVERVFRGSCLSLGKRDCLLFLNRPSLNRGTTVSVISPNQKSISVL